MCTVSEKLNAFISSKMGDRFESKHETPLWSSQAKLLFLGEIRSV